MAFSFATLKFFKSAWRLEKQTEMVYGFSNTYPTVTIHIVP